MSIFDDTPDVFADQSVFSPGFQPELLWERRAHIREITFELESLRDGVVPVPVVLYGPPGTGKSTTAAYLREELQRELGDAETPVTTISVDVTSGETAYQTSIKLANELRAVVNQDALPSTGHSQAHINEKLIEALNAADGIIFAAIDDFHLLENPNDLLNTISRVRERSEAAAQLGYMLITNDKSFVDELESDTKSSFQSTANVCFERYESDELYEILSLRAADGFYQGLVTEESLRLCAAKADKEGGDARYAIRLLEEAGRKTGKRQLKGTDGSSKMTTEDVERANQELGGFWYTQSLSELGEKAFRLVQFVAAVAARGRTPCGSGLISDIFNEESVYDLGPRTVRNMLDTLVRQGLLVYDTGGKGPKGGSYRRYRLGEELFFVLQALAEAAEETEFEVSIDQAATSAVQNGFITASQKKQIVD